MKRPSRGARASGRPKVLCVDDEPQVLEGLKLHLRRKFDVRTASSGAEGLAALRDGGPFAVILSDLQMPAMHGSGFLSRVREIAPDSVRMVLSGLAELTTAVEAVNEGQIFRFLTKPCSPDQLVRAFEAAADQYRLITAERVLLEETLRGSIRSLTNLLSLTNPAAFGRATRLKRYVGRLASQLGVSDRWEVEVAAMLSQTGCVTLPATTAEKLYYSRELDEDERALVNGLPETTVKLIGDIPRLEGVRAILLHQCKQFDGDGPGPRNVSGDDIPLGARLLKLALDYDSLETLGVQEEARVEKLLARTGWYDPEALNALEQLVSDMSINGQLRDCGFDELQPGMVLAGDVMTESNRLLIARGLEVTDGLIARLGHHRSERIREPIRVLIPDVRPDTD